MQTLESAPSHIKLATEDKAGIFSGYASTFNDVPDSQGHIITPGAFSDSLKEHRSRNSKPAMLWHHNSREPIGIWTEFAEDERGLLVKGQLALDVPLAANAHSLAKMGALAMSIGFTYPQSTADRQDNLVRLNKINLLEISLVSMPSNRSAQILQVKAFDPENPNVREFERAARDALGLTSREVKRLLSGGWSALVRDERSDSSTELASIVEKLEAITHELRNK